MRLIANAKVNWALSVLGKREDGYHELDMVMQSVTLCDTLSIQPADSLLLRVRGAPVPASEKNLVLRAAKALQTFCGVSYGAEFLLKKRIPIGGGLGGGSADAAATLLGLNMPLGPAAKRKRTHAARSFLRRRCSVLPPWRRCPRRGASEKSCNRFPSAHTHPLVIVQPCRGLSTPSVFSAFDALQHPPSIRIAGRLCVRWRTATQRRSPRPWGNVLEAAAVPARPEISACAQALEHFGALSAQMTGSGSAVIALFADAAAAESARTRCAPYLAARLYRLYHDGRRIALRGVALAIVFLFDPFIPQPAVAWPVVF